MPSKHQPDLIYLRYVPLWKVHIFTLVQLTCLVLLWVIKASAAAVVFPMMVDRFLHFTSMSSQVTFKQNYRILRSRSRSGVYKPHQSKNA